MAESDGIVLAPAANYVNYYEWQMACLAQRPNQV